MDRGIDKISLMGRLGYVLMCLEKYLTNIYPDRDWTLLAKALWKFSRWTVSDWMFLYGDLTPDTVLHGGEFNADVGSVFTPEEYQELRQQYCGITQGNLENPNDELCMALNIPFDLIYHYDAAISHGNSNHERAASEFSIQLTHKIENVLSKHDIELPDIHKLDFLMIKDDDIWGDQFDGEPLSIILNKP